MSCGYMNTMYGNIFEGQYRNGAAAPVGNGTLMVLDPATMKLKLPAADTTSKFLVTEVTTIYGGVPAVNVTVEKLAGRYYFVETMQEYNDATEYDLTEYAVPVDAFVRAHPLEVNDKFYVSTDGATYAAGTSYGVLATGRLG